MKAPDTGVYRSSCSASPLGEGAGDGRSSLVDTIGADIKIVAHVTCVGGIMPGQLAEAAAAVIEPTEVDLVLARLRDQCAGIAEIGVPERVGVPVKGKDGFIDAVARWC